VLCLHGRIVGEHPWLIRSAATQQQLYEGRDKNADPPCMVGSTMGASCRLKKENEGHLHDRRLLLQAPQCTALGLQFASWQGGGAFSKKKFGVAVISCYQRFFCGGRRFLGPTLTSVLVSDEGKTFLLFGLHLPVLHAHVAATEHHRKALINAAAKHYCISTTRGARYWAQAGQSRAKPEWARARGQQDNSPAICCRLTLMLVGDACASIRCTKVLFNK
jgi:hypothetical protein